MPLSKKKYLHVSSRKLKIASARTIILEIIEHWQSTLPVKEDSLHITLTIIQSLHPQKPINYEKIPKILEALNKYSQFPPQSWFFCFYNCT